MATYTNYKSLEKPLSTEKYNIDVANKNNDVIDSELPESVKLIVFIYQSTIRLAKSRKCTLIMLNKPVLM